MRDEPVGRAFGLDLLARLLKASASVCANTFASSMSVPAEPVERLCKARSRKE